jgi:hypothetical protein
VDESRICGAARKRDGQPLRVAFRAALMRGLVLLDAVRMGVCGGTRFSGPIGNRSNVRKSYANWAKP